MPRLFAALEIPPEAGQALAGLRCGLPPARKGWEDGRANNNARGGVARRGADNMRKPGQAGRGADAVRWIEPADYHITLRFYGDVSFAIADEIVAALGKIQARAFSLALKGIQVFSPKKPRSLYAQVAAAAELLALQEKIEHISRRLVPPETRKFTPHITLARLKQADEQSLAAWLAARGNFTAPPWPVKRFCLMSAKDSVGGGPYIIEESWPLA